MRLGTGAPLHPVTLILGGARSGKSRYAQSLAARAERVLFLATATPADDEMRSKIARHRADRQNENLAHWTILEEPIALAEPLNRYGLQHDLILIDCLTLYAANLLALTPEARTQNLESFYATLITPPAPILLVSNEVGSGIVPEYPSGRQYRDLLGEVNQRVASLATEAVLLTAGLPITLKTSVLSP